jgi:hypothetical protein
MPTIADAAHAQRSISDIAFGYGFNDMAHFSGSNCDRARLASGVAEPCYFFSNPSANTPSRSTRE